MHEADLLHSQISRLSGQVALLSERASASAFTAFPLVQESIADLQTALEELRVSEEEMRVATEDLATTQFALDAERQRYWQLFHFAPDAYLVTDDGAMVREANRAAAELLGVPLDRLPGKPLANFVAEEDRRAFRQRFRHLAQGDEGETDLTVVRRDGGRVRVSFRSGPMPAGKGQAPGVLCLLRDVTEREAAREHARRLEAEHIARVEAERANRVKSEFLAVMSHELRTPLTSIMAYTELLQMGIPAAVPDAVQPHLGCIDDASRHLLLLIEEILGFTRLEAGREEVKPVEMDLRELVGEVRTFLEPLALKRGLDLRFHAPDTPVQVATDRAKVRQILINLVSNAVKFTATGSVALELEADADGATFRVSDTGVGIAPENLERVFEPFWQAQQGTTRNVGGTGLGLSIARKMAQVLGGDLTAHSTGTGSTFILRLPLEAPALE